MPALHGGVPEAEIGLQGRARNAPALAQPELYSLAWDIPRPPLKPIYCLSTQSITAA